MTTQPGARQSSFFLIVQWIALVAVMIALIVFIYQQNRLWRHVESVKGDVVSLKKDVRNWKKGHGIPNIADTTEDRAEGPTGQPADSAGKQLSQDSGAGELVLPPAEPLGAKTGDSKAKRTVTTRHPIKPSSIGQSGSKPHGVTPQASKAAERKAAERKAAAHKALSKHARAHAKARSHRTLHRFAEGRTGGGGAETHHLFVPLRSYANEAEAKTERDRLLRRGLPATLRRGSGSTSVVLGPFASRQQAEQYKGYALR